MYIELEREEICLLERLIEMRQSELHPEIRRTRQAQMHDELKLELESLERLLHRLHECECDVMA